MTDYVSLPNSSFAHDRLHLAPPNGLQGGAYFSMLYYKDAPLYIQTPKCISRQGVVAGKRPYIDLMFSSHDVSFLEWLEALEADAVRLIHDKRNLWISSDIEKSDIEAGFTSPVRPYKGGKYYLIRAHIQPAKHLATGGASSCSVFDENERPVPIEYIKPEHQMYAVLEFQGIKFTARSFQMEVAIKQVLLVPNVPLFQSCVIRRPSQHEHEPHTVQPKEDDHDPQIQPKKDEGIGIIQTNKNEETTQPIQPVQINENEETIQAIQPAVQINENEETTQPIQSVQVNKNEETIQTIQPVQVNKNEETIQSQPVQPIQPVQPTQPKEESPKQDLQEVNLDVLEELEHMHLKLKKPTQVYYEMYRIAKQKAKELKKNAIAAYLEAKQIKSAHMLEDSSSDSDDDENDCGDSVYSDEMHE